MILATLPSKSGSSRDHRGISGEDCQRTKSQKSPENRRSGEPKEAELPKREEGGDSKPGHQRLEAGSRFLDYGDLPDRVFCDFKRYNFLIFAIFCDVRDFHDLKR